MSAFNSGARVTRLLADNAAAAYLNGEERDEGGSSLKVFSRRAGKMASPQGSTQWGGVGGRKKAGETTRSITRAQVPKGKVSHAPRRLSMRLMGLPYHHYQHTGHAAENLGT
jgi:hypothetical protein